MKRKHSFLRRKAAIAAGSALLLAASSEGQIYSYNVPQGAAEYVTSPLTGGTAKLIKTGPGTLVLTASNSYGGSTTIESGTVLLNGTGAFINHPSSQLLVHNGELVIRRGAASVGVTIFGEANGETGGLSIDNGYLASSSVYLGNGAGSVGYALLENGAEWNVDYSLSIGFSGTGSVYLKGGSALSAESIYLGEEAGSDGSLIAENGLLSAYNLTIGNAGSAGVGLYDGSTMVVANTTLADDPDGYGVLLVRDSSFSTNNLTTGAGLADIVVLEQGELEVLNQTVLGEVDGYESYVFIDNATWLQKGDLLLRYAYLGLDEQALLQTDADVVFAPDSFVTVLISGSSLWRHLGNELVLNGDTLLAVGSGGTLEVLNENEEPGVLRFGESGEQFVFIGSDMIDEPAAPGYLNVSAVQGADSGAHSLVFNHTGTNYVFSATLLGPMNVIHRAGNTTFDGIVNVDGIFYARSGNVHITGTEAAFVATQAGAGDTGYLLFSNGVQAQIQTLGVVDNGKVEISGADTMVLANGLYVGYSLALPDPSKYANLTISNGAE